MSTTIQVDDKTLLLLKQLKEEFGASSYAEAIMQVVAKSRKKKSMAGSLKKYYINTSLSEILKGLRDKHDRL